MPDIPNTIRLEIPKRRIAADLLGLARLLGEAATQGLLLQNWGNAIANLFSAASTIRIERSESVLAWQLLLMGIGEALTDVANQQPPTLINEEDVKTICKRIEHEAVDLTIPVNFLDRPWILPPVVLAKKTLLKWLTPPANSAAPQDLINLARRFDSALVLGLHRAIRTDEARYRPVVARREDPTGPAWQMLEDWRRYRAWLVSEFRAAPVFDESFAIDQLYVPLNAWHWVKQEPNAKPRTKKLRTVVNLNDDMAAWLRGERSNNRLRLVSGGPGSGKSSAMKALAASPDQAGNNDQPTNAHLFMPQPDVLLFPLQRFQWRAGIVESVAATLNTYGDQMRHNPLDPDHLRDRQTPLLLIFDGLDELTANVQVSEAISTIFLRELNTTLRSWQDRPVWVIVTGRDAIFGNVEGPTATLPGERLHLLPYHVREHEPEGPSRSNYHDPGNLLSEDNREKVFRRYARAKGHPSDQLPEMYGNDDLHDLSAQPLLNYFMLTSGPNEFADGNLARIYGRMFERLHSRNRNDDGRLHDAGKPAASLSQDLFDRAFETIAVAAWRTGGTRAASWDEVLKEVEREDSYLKSDEHKLLDVFDTQMLDRGAQRPFRLAAAFFSRNDQATGVEFTHKSFADYLYARRLAKAVAAMADALHRTPELEQEMLRRWEALTSAQRMSYEVAHLLKLEIEATVDAATLRRRNATMQSVVDRVLRAGWQVLGETCQRRAEQLSCQLEEALFIAWHAMWLTDGGHCYWQLGEDTGDLLYRALARQESVHGRQFGQGFVAHWSGGNFSGTNFVHLNLSRANLGGTNLRGANLSFSRLNQAVLTDAKLEDAILAGAVLAEADLRNADLTGADLTGATLRKANLKGAVLTGVVLRKADLTGAVLTSADLTGAVLTDANLENADLERANLENADLTGAVFTGAFLMNSVLVGASLRDADLTEADLRGANLRDVAFEGADLTDTDLT